MPEARLRRHDLVWLDAASADRCDVAAVDRPAFENWLARGLPLVVGRQDGKVEGLRLGFTRPGTGRRWRVGVVAPANAIKAKRPPPLLADLAAEALPAWRRPIAALARALAESGLTARGYGSLVTQALSGEACLRPDSDVDVLVDCRSRHEAETVLELLACHGGGAPRIDGEIRMADGRAVAWRELAWALATGSQVLAKSDTDVQLLSPGEFLGNLNCRGAHSCLP